MGRVLVILLLAGGVLGAVLLSHAPAGSIFFLPGTDPFTRSTWYYQEDSGAVYAVVKPEFYDQARIIGCPVIVDGLHTRTMANVRLRLRQRIGSLYPVGSIEGKKAWLHYCQKLYEEETDWQSRCRTSRCYS